MGKGGRPRKTGERYPSGDIKPMGEPIAPAIWDRIRKDVAKMAGDPRLASELSRLGLHRELSASQVTAGFKVAEIYGRYERLSGYSRSTRSASYESGFSSGGPSIADELLPAEVLKKKIEAEQEIRGAFMTLQRALEIYPQRLRGMIEDICVEDRNVGPVALIEVRKALQSLAGVFGTTTRGQNAKRSPVERRAAPQVREKRVDVEREAFDEVLTRLRPDMDPEARKGAFAIKVALTDRAKFRRDKERSAREKA